MLAAQLPVFYRKTTVKNRNALQITYYYSTGFSRKMIPDYGLIPLVGIAASHWI
jgi:hypothetical protein